MLTVWPRGRCGKGRRWVKQPLV